MQPDRPAPRAFPRSARLLSPPQFRACFESGHRLSSALFRVHWQHAEQPRLGLAVSRKVSTRAVDRNRIKRVARERFRQSHEQLPPIDIVLLAKREAAAAGRDRLAADLDGLLRRLAVAALKRPEAAGTMRADPATAAPGAVDPPTSPIAAAIPPAASRPSPE
jgi:ribonuclease P protein component